MEEINKTALESSNDIEDGFFPFDLQSTPEEIAEYYSENTETKSEVFNSKKEEKIQKQKRKAKGKTATPRKETGDKISNEVILDNLETLYLKLYLAKRDILFLRLLLIKKGVSLRQFFTEIIEKELSKMKSELGDENIELYLEMYEKLNNIKG